MPETTDVIDNSEGRRFELAMDGELAFADYRLAGDVVRITHVETPLALRGGGVASRLMAGALAIIRGRGQKVKPVCPYAVAYIKRHPAEQDLLT
jgi:hypothetical protein